MTTTTRSQDALRSCAAQYLAGGVGSGTRSPRSGWLPPPVFVRSGDGRLLTDEDGNGYIDYVMGQGPLILGHRPPAGDRGRHRDDQRARLAVLARARPRGRGGRARSSRACPSIDMLRFSSTGTEAAMYALRFARAFTGRTLIVRFEGHYHGWSDAIHWSAHPSPDTWGPADAPTVLPGSTGIPAAVGETLLVAPLERHGRARARCSQRHGDQIAAVITEPIMGNCGGVMPARRLPGAHARADARRGQRC